MNIFNPKYIQRIKNISKKDLFIDLLLLLLPTLILLILVYGTIYTYGVSLLFFYFVLPMFYCVDQRLRYHINGIGKKKITYLDGYRDFFASNKGGYFGMTICLLSAIGLFLFFLGVMTLILPYVFACFPISIPAYERFIDMIKTTTFTRFDMLGFFLENGSTMVQPLTVYFGVSSFLPIFFIIFLSVDNNLSLHYISSIILPDLDKNISSSQSRSVAKSFTRAFSSYRMKENLKLNFIYYIIFTLIYGLSLWGASRITVSSIELVVPVFMLAPCFSILIGSFLNHFCTMNEYIVIEESQNELSDSIPLTIKTSIYQTYNSRGYIHGIESEKRGCFINLSEDVSYKEDSVFDEKPNAYMVDLSNEFNDKGGD